MADHINQVTDHFRGKFITSPAALNKKLLGVKAYVFDWDGVFNNGQKGENGSSPFNEIDSMGTNLLRFGHFLRTGELPLFIIISGENNKAAQTLAKREHFYSVYSGIKNKIEALDHLTLACGISDGEIAFMFDDVLDLAIAPRAGVRFMVGRECNPLMTEYVLSRDLADYITSCEGGQNAVREVTELVMGLTGSFEQAITERIRFSSVYQDYLDRRSRHQPLFYTSKEGKITEHTL